MIYHKQSHTFVFRFSFSRASLRAMRAASLSYLPLPPLCPPPPSSSLLLSSAVVNTCSHMRINTPQGACQMYDVCTQQLVHVNGNERMRATVRVPSVHARNANATCTQKLGAAASQKRPLQCLRSRLPANAVSQITELGTSNKHPRITSHHPDPPTTSINSDRKENKCHNTPERTLRDALGLRADLIGACCVPRAPTAPGTAVAAAVAAPGPTAGGPAGAGVSGAGVKGCARLKGRVRGVGMGRERSSRGSLPTCCLGGGGRCMCEAGVRCGPVEGVGTAQV